MRTLILGIIVSAWLIVFALLFGGMALGAEVESLALPGYKVELPDGAGIPNRSALVLKEERYNPADTNMMMYMWKEFGVSYFNDKTGEFTYPYIEMTYVSEGETFLIVMAFINPETLQSEVYMSEVLFGGTDIKKFIVREAGLKYNKASD